MKIKDGKWLSFSLSPFPSLSLDIYLSLYIFLSLSSLSMYMYIGISLSLYLSLTHTLFLFLSNRWAGVGFVPMMLKSERLVSLPLKISLYLIKTVINIYYILLKTLIISFLFLITIIINIFYVKKSMEWWIRIINFTY